MLASFTKFKTNLLVKLVKPPHKLETNFPNSPVSSSETPEELEEPEEPEEPDSPELQLQPSPDLSQESQASPTLPQFPLPSNSSLSDDVSSLPPPLNSTPSPDPDPDFRQIQLELLRQPLSLAPRTARRSRIRNTVQFPLTKLPPVCQRPEPEPTCSNTVKSLCNGLLSKPRYDTDTNCFEDLLDHFTLLNPLLYSHPSNMVYSVVKKSTLQVNTARIFKKASSYESTLENRKRLQREIFITSQLEHPNVLKLLDVCFHFNLPFIISDGGYFDGLGLKELSPLPTATALSLLGDLLEGLQYIHSRNVVHLDLCLENVVVFYDGTLKLSNFAQATLLDPTDPHPPLDFMYAKATPYSSPELVSHRTEVTDLKACDTWSAGILGAQILTGLPPWELAHPTDPNYHHYLTTKSPLTFTDPTVSPYHQLLTNLLDPSPHHRYTASQAVEFYYYLQNPSHAMLGNLATVYM